MTMVSPSSSPDHLAAASIWDRPVPVAQARHRSLLPSTSWAYLNEATLRFLRRQQQRAETTLHLEAVVVQDERGLVALWTGEHSTLPRPVS